MGDISRYLQEIMNAKYGEEVRGSIYNAIRECYTDVMASQTKADNAIAQYNTLVGQLDQKVQQAASSAEAASGSATAASTSATNASNSASDASDSADEARALVDSIDSMTTSDIDAAIAAG